MAALVPDGMAAPSAALSARRTIASYADVSEGILRLRCALAKDGGPDRDQTDDLVVANDALYQLSYWPVRNVTYCEIVASK